MLSRGTSTVSVRFGDTDITEMIENAIRESVADALDRKCRAVMLDALTPPPTVRFVPFSGEIHMVVPEHLRYVFLGVCPAAHIRACLWRRNLDDGNWRTRGHVAHRRG